MNACLGESVSASTRPRSGDSGTSSGEGYPGSMSRNAEDAHLSFDGVSPEKPLARSGVTPREAAINLANCIMGAGALSLPSFFKSTGAVLGVALLLASCAWTWFSAVMMVKAADVVSIRVLDGVPVSSYEELMDLTLGRSGKRLSAVGILLLQIGCLVGYANILADVVSPFAISVLPPGLEPNRGAVLAAVTLGAMLPVGVAVGGDGGSAGLATVSKASVVIVGAFALILSTLGAAKTAEFASSDARARAHAGLGAATSVGDTTETIEPLAMVRLDGMMSVLPLAIFAFGAHPAILPVTSAMRPSGLQPSVAAVTDVLRMCAVGYSMIGLGGYASFRERTAGNVLRNVDGAVLGSFGSKALKFGYGLVILASVPTILLPVQKSARDAYLTLLPYVVPPTETDTRDAKGGDARSDRLDDAVPPEIASRLATVVAVASLTCALYLSLYVPNVAFAFGLTGSTCSFLIAFVLPAVSFLSATAVGARRLPGAARRRSLELARRDASRRGSRAKPADEPSAAEEAFAAAAASGQSVSARGESSLMRRSGSQEGSVANAEASWAWFGGEDPDSDRRRDDALCFDDGFDDGFVRPDALFDERNSNRATSTPSRGSTGAPISPTKGKNISSVPSKHASTRRWRLGAKAQILAAIFLSVACTREVVRELAHENALVTVVSKMAEAKASARKIEKESDTIVAAKEKFVGASVELKRASKDAERALDEVHHRRADGEARATGAGKTTSRAADGFASVETSDANLGAEIDVIVATPEERPSEAIDGRVEETREIESDDRSALPRSRAVAVAETVGVAEASLEEVRKVEAMASNATAAKSALEDAIKRSDDEVRKVTRAEGSAEVSGEALDVERKPEEQELDPEPMAVAADAEARWEVSKSSARDWDKTPRGGAARSDRQNDSRMDASSSTHLTTANALDVVAMADEKINELHDAKAKVETEAEKALETAVTAEGVDETLASELADALANLTGSA